MSLNNYALSAAVAGALPLMSAYQTAFNSANLVAVKLQSLPPKLGRQAHLLSLVALFTLHSPLGAEQLFSHKLAPPRGKLAGLVLVAGSADLIASKRACFYDGVMVAKLMFAKTSSFYRIWLHSLPYIFLPTRCK